MINTNIVAGVAIVALAIIIFAKIYTAIKNKE